MHVETKGEACEEPHDLSVSKIFYQDLPFLPFDESDRASTLASQMTRSAEEAIDETQSNLGDK